jgi:cytochrome c
MIRRTVSLAGSFIFCASFFVGAAYGQDDKAAKGKTFVEGQNCTLCHNLDTDEKKMGPSLKGLYKRKTLQNGKPVTDENVMDQVTNGGGGMPGYPDLTADDKANLLAYLHTL